MSSDESIPPLIRAVLWMGLALLSFVFMAIAVREIADGMHAFQMVFIRSVVGFLIIVVLFSINGWHTFHTQRLAGHALRDLFQRRNLTEPLSQCDISALEETGILDSNSSLIGKIKNLLVE